MVCLFFSLKNYSKSNQNIILCATFYLTKNKPNKINKMDIDSLTTCCLANTKKRQALSTEKLKQQHELPCGCEEVALEDLLSICECQECGEQYYYSFCRKEILEEDHFWHCTDCGKCRESAEWHCKKCDDCTYGLTLSCDHCGKKSPYMPG